MQFTSTCTHSCLTSLPTCSFFLHLPVLFLKNHHPCHSADNDLYDQHNTQHNSNSCSWGDKCGAATPSCIFSATGVPFDVAGFCHWVMVRFSWANSMHSSTSDSAQGQGACTTLQAINLTAISVLAKSH